MKTTVDRFGALTLTDFSIEQGALDAILRVPGVKRWMTEVVVSRTAVPAVETYLRHEGLVLPQPGMVPGADDMVQGFVDRGVLRGYQAEASRRILTQGGLVLADRVGLGKTRAAAVAAYTASKTHDDRPILILAPKFLRVPWREELHALGVLRSEEDMVQVEGLKPDLAKLQTGARWFFCHYEIVRAWWTILWPMRPVMAILDEAHYVKSARSARGKAAQLVALSCPYRALLTATPVLNRLGEFWHLLTLAGGPWSWGSPKDFKFRYSAAYEDEYGTHGDDTVKHWTQPELHARLGTCYLRRGLEDVDLELPPVTRSVHGTSYDGSALDRLVEEHPELPHWVELVVSGGKLPAGAIEVLTKLRKITGDVKVDGTVAYVRSMREQDENVLVFTWRQATAEQIRDGVKGRGLYAQVGLVHGGLSQKKRDAAVARFKDKGGVLVATYGALGVGVNLQVARIVVMHDLDWTPATLVQAEGRVWRGGQTKHVQSVWRILTDTLDEYLARMLVKKAKLVAEAAQDPEAERLTEVFGALEEEDQASAWVDRYRDWREKSIR